MDPSLKMPELTAFDAVTELIAAAVYLAIGAAALAQAPRDERTRVFGAFGLMNAVGLCIPAGAWFLGVSDPLAFGRVPLGVLLAALAVGALLMFHFCQVFPRRRPWIRSAGAQLPIAYAITPIAVFVLVRGWPASQADVTDGFKLAFVVFGFPLLVLLGLVLPVGSIVSLLRSLRDTATARPAAPSDRPADPAPDARPAVAGILFSQIAGGVLSLLVLAPLHSAAPDSLAVVFAALAVWLLGLLTPVAYAAGVWKYNVLAISADGSLEVKPD